MNLALKLAPSLPMPRALARHLTVARHLVATWRRRYRSRRELARLGDRQMHDVGIARWQAEREARKPFWRE